jgi:thiamine biosynthesis protein ThiS
MNIVLNDKPVEIPEGTLLRDLLAEYGYRKCAVIINGRHILLKDYESCILKKDDNIMLVRILGGG